MSGYDVHEPVVTGVSRSTTARGAVAWAADAAARRGRPLCLVHAQEWPAGAAPKDRHDEPEQIWASHFRAAGQSVLDDLLESTAASRPGLQITTRLLDGRPASVLREAAEAASLLVVGVHQVAGPGEAVTFGGVGPALVGHPPCPVVLVPELTSGFDPYGPVMVGVDGSAASAPAVSFAFEEAAAWDADLLAVQVRRPRHGDWPADMAESAIDISEALAGWQEKYPQVTVRQEVLVGNPAVQLAEAATDARCLVVGSRGVGGFRGMVLGSTSRSLAHMVPGPLAVVPHKAASD
ncbi:MULTISPECIES: universal stress protein [unclassified Streptomyces]|uniref:universal stress protein n=1 Tax=Streptomyces TaxID=1883 RepID=UPI000823D6C1|nr:MULTISPECIES: universal stress protein [unclassified Streptomyces]AWN30532.1 universal stress protein [Streptomyces sp. NEAU-S7GS2]MYT16733.1 universal stress protein [Streptomyces sp. SID4951]SCK34818.1 Nucleotide-binding universal stress protein, UspA family [Streptomyces sp. SceaMP-e96]